jgi:hypothetical protein
MSFNKSKIVVFDMDETLGYFLELGIFWDSLHNYCKHKLLNSNSLLDQDFFISLLDIFPEFLRPNIISVLNYIKLKKLSKKCQSVMIYTNNQGPKEWVHLIKNYFDSKLDYKLFNHVISAFKVNGKHLEMCRTTHDKNINDFIKCSKLPENVEICFLDDTYYPEMNQSNVYYIKLKPYIHDLQFDEMINRFLNSKISKIFYKTHEEKDAFINFMKTYTESYQYVYSEKSKKEYQIDKIITKKTMEHLQIFFKSKDSPSDLRKNRTSKQKSYNKTKTRKNLS